MRSQSFFRRCSQFIRRAAIPVLSFFFTCCGSSSTFLPPAGASPLDIPRLDEITIDGRAEDWPEEIPPIRLLSDIRGRVPEPGDFDARFRLAWNRDGLYILAEVSDDSLYEDRSRFWNGDGIEIFVSPRPGSPEIVQVSLRPSFDLPDSSTAIVYYDHRRSGPLKEIMPESVFSSYKSDHSYRMEGRIPLDMIGIPDPGHGTEMAVQLYMNDSDGKGDTATFSLPWFPVRDSYRNPYAFHRVRFTEPVNCARIPEIRAYIMNGDLLRIKLLSRDPPAGNQLIVRAGHCHKRIKLREGQNGIYSQEIDLPAGKFNNRDEELLFLLDDSLYFRIPVCLLHRFYEEGKEPNRFENEIRIFEVLDCFKPPPENLTLFTGSSSIRMWYHLPEDLPGIPLLNRGFGGSSMKDLNYYFGRIVLPYRPSRIIVYEGDNDISNGTSPEAFLEECVKFINACREYLPGVQIYFVSVKPSPARFRYWPLMQKANAMLQDLANRNPGIHYIDITADMLNADGEPREDIFLEDGIHMNETGYGLWTDVLREALYE